VSLPPYLLAIPLVFQWPLSLALGNPSLGCSSTVLFMILCRHWIFNLPAIQVLPLPSSNCQVQLIPQLQLWVTCCRHRCGLFVPRPQAPPFRLLYVFSSLAICIICSIIYGMRKPFLRITIIIVLSLLSLSQSLKAWVSSLSD